MLSLCRLGATAFFLAYTAIVVPPVISYHWLDPPCVTVPTLYFDVLLDCFFLLDIIYNFNVGIILPGGDYIDGRQEVAIQYLRGMFTFDVVTSFPVSFIEVAAAAECQVADGVDSAVDGGQLRIIRALKPLRWFKLARIVKLGKADQILDAVTDYWMISPRLTKTAKVLGTLLLVVHIFSCAWWLWKVFDFELHQAEQFLDEQPWGNFDRHPLTTPMGKVEAYTISLYLVTMTLTTVGCGHIPADLLRITYHSPLTTVGHGGIVTTVVGYCVCDVY